MPVDDQKCTAAAGAKCFTPLAKDGRRSGKGVAGHYCPLIYDTVRGRVVTADADVVPWVQRLPTGGALEAGVARTACQQTGKRSCRARGRDAPARDDADDSLKVWAIMCVCRTRRASN